MSNLHSRKAARRFSGRIEVKEGAAPTGPDAKVVTEIVAEVKAMGGDVKALRDGIQGDLAKLRAEMEGVKGGLDPLIKTKMDALTESVLQKNEALAVEFKKQTDRLDGIETAMKRAPAGPTAQDEADREIKDANEFFTLKATKEGKITAGQEIRPEMIDAEGYRLWAKNYGKYLRKDGQFVGTTPEGAKALSVGSDPDGGYMVPTAQSNRILGKVFESSPMRQLAMVETIGSDAMEIAVDEGEVGYGWVGETETRSETTTSQIGVAKITVHEIYAKPRATQKLLEDSSLDVERWLGNKVSDKFARVESSAFVNGNGVNKPRGILTYATGTTRGTIEQVASGAATEITADGLIRLTFTLKDAYLANASWLMKRSTQAAVMLLKDGQGQYMWRPGLEASRPNTLLGYPLRQADDMPAVTAGTLSVAFGDFRQAYTIVDRKGITTLRDPFSAKPFVEFYSRRRVGGDVVLFEAIKLLVTAAS